MKPASRQLSVIIPAYNEERVIVNTLAATQEALAHLDYEIVVVDDGSADATARLVEQATLAEPRVAAVRLHTNRGKGHALRAGFEHTRGDRVAFLDADLDLHPRLLCDLMAVMDATQADGVIGSKLHPASQVDYPLSRRVLSLGYSLMIRALFGLPVLDTQTGIKLFRRAVLAEVLPLLTIDGFAYDLQLLVLAQQRHYTLTGAPVVLTFQRQRLGRLGWRAVWQIWRDTLIVFWRTR